MVKSFANFRFDNACCFSEEDRVMVLAHIRETWKNDDVQDGCIVFEQFVRRHLSKHIHEEHGSLLAALRFLCSNSVLVLVWQLVALGYVFSSQVTKVFEEFFDTSFEDPIFAGNVLGNALPGSAVKKRKKQPHWMKTANANEPTTKIPPCIQSGILTACNAWAARYTSGNHEAFQRLEDCKQALELRNMTSESPQQQTEQQQKQATGTADSPLPILSGVDKHSTSMLILSPKKVSISSDMPSPTELNRHSATFPAALDPLRESLEGVNFAGLELPQDDDTMDEVTERRRTKQTTSKSETRQRKSTTVPSEPTARSRARGVSDHVCQSAPKHHKDCRGQKRVNLPTNSPDGMTTLPLPRRRRDNPEGESSHQLTRRSHHMQTESARLVVGPKRSCSEIIPSSTSRRHHARSDRKCETPRASATRLRVAPLNPQDGDLPSQSSTSIATASHRRRTRHEKRAPRTVARSTSKTKLDDDTRADDHERRKKRANTTGVAAAQKVEETFN
jgi:hypothetical protein